MCKCTPEIRTPWCGKPGCENPLDTVDISQAKHKPECPTCGSVYDGVGKCACHREAEVIMSEPLSNAQQKCPECLNALTFRESSFAQYQPSVYWCEHCQEEKQYNYVHWFNKGYERASVDQLSPDVDKLADILYDQFDIALVEKQLEDLINQKHSSTIMEIQTIRGTAKIQCVRIAQEIINKMGKWIKKG